MAKESRLEAIRRAVLRDWRGGDDPAHPDERLHLPKDFLAAILRQAGATEGIDEERLREMWKEVAGDFIARHAAPVSLKGGCLTLHVLQPAMRFHLEQSRAELLRKIQQAAGPGVVKMIRFSVG
jgi:predicted nucleic acid-binding Zn ribbon protein